MLIACVSIDIHDFMVLTSFCASGCLKACVWRTDRCYLLRFGEVISGLRQSYFVKYSFHESKINL